MKKLILITSSLILVLAIVFSLKSRNHDNPLSPDRAELSLAKEWLYTTAIDNLKNNGELITRPPGIDQLLFRITLPEVGGIDLKTHCVYYRVPYKQIEGLLQIVEFRGLRACPEMNTIGAWIKFSGIKDLSVNLENFKLQMQFKINNQLIHWDFILPNISSGTIHEKYQAQKDKKLFKNLTFLRIDEESFEKSNNRYLGKLSDRVSRGTAIRCQQVDKNCQIVGEDRCDECRYGWYQVVDFNCPQGGSRYCGQNHCGEKLEPACPRGNKVVGGDDAGICQNDLTPVLSSEHILICQ